MSNIIDAVKVFSKLLDIEYEIILAKKNKKVQLNVVFQKEHCHHLLGLQYLEDREALNKDRAMIFDKILSGQITPDFIESSQFYPKIKERVHYLSMLESIFDDNGTIFKYDEKENILTSQIKGDYLMSNSVDSRNIFTFLSKNDDEMYYCRSFFPQTFKDYSYRQKKWTVILKKKIFKKFGESIVLYDYFAEKARRAQDGAHPAD